MRKVRSKAPLRISLAGGGTDISPFCDVYGGKLINITMSRYAYTTIESNIENRINFASIDQDCKSSYTLEEEFIKKSKLFLLENTYSYLIEKYNDNKRIPLNITTFSDCPIGSGLGASSTLVVSTICALLKYLDIQVENNQIASDSFHIERIICDQAGGRQDQYSATHGGLNFMEFGDINSNVITPIEVDPWILNELECSLHLFSTELSRDSSLIIKDQSNIQFNNISNFDAMNQLKAEAEQMREHLLRGDFEGIKNSMKNTWEAKKKTSNLVTNDYLNSIYESAIAGGASAGKISGAGGGGHMLFLIPPENRRSVMNNLSKYTGNMRNCHFNFKGCEAWSSS